MASVRGSNTCAIANYGDLCLNVGHGEGAMSFVVRSSTLARIAKFWKVLLLGGFAESRYNKGKSDWVVSLPEDNVKAMRTFLYICNAYFVPVPTDIEIDDLYQLTVLTNKYGSTHVLRPWAKGWSMRMSKLQGMIYERIWIAWELGDESLFKSLALEFIRDAEIVQPEEAQQVPYDALEVIGFYGMSKVFGIWFAYCS